MQDDRESTLPPYAYVPGGPWPHPTSSPQGHSAGKPPSRVPAIEGGDWAASDAYRHGIELFNAGYYWEAHEAWEALWHAHGRKGPTADVIKALIKLAAAGVKVREGQPHGVKTHANRAGTLFASVHAEAGRHQLGLDLEEWADIAHRVATNPPVDDAPSGQAVARVFGFTIKPRE